jgi:group I intron endonuclease
MKQKFINKSFVVYKIHCNGNGKDYIGITNDFNRRFAVHWNDAFNCNKQTVLCRTMRKYGKNDFVISKIDNAHTWESACELEKKYIKNFNTKVPNGMNMTDGGDGVFGLKHSDKTKEQMRKSHLGKGIGEDNPMYGKPGSMLGKKWSDESRKKLSESCKGRVPWNKGKKGLQKAWNKGKTGIFSEEALKKMSATHKGKKWSKEARKKMSETRKGRFVGEKHSQSKLIKDDVIEIRRLYGNKILTQKQIAERYGLTQGNVSYIVYGKSWGHVKEGILLSSIPCNRRETKLTKVDILEIRKLYKNKTFNHS